MEKAIALLATLAALQLSGLPVAHAQQGFDMEPLGLISSPQKGRIPLRIGQSRAVAIKRLGTPTKQGKVFFEMDDDTAVVLYYHANRLYFLKDRLEGFELNDNTLAFGRSYEQAFRVGAVLKAPAKQGAPGNAGLGVRYLVGSTPLVGLHVNTKPGRSRNLNYKTSASNYTRWGKQEYDAWFEMLFDANNKIINIGTGYL